MIDQESFLQQLNAWHAIPYSVISKDPSKLAPDLLAFPALLFQMIAQALLLLPYSAFNLVQDLKHRPDMSFADLAVEYSEVGHKVLALLGNRDIDLSKVQASLLRASFQKSTGSVVEAWHTLGSTIRDAQEMGLHRIQSAHCTDSANSSLESLRDCEMRLRLWLLLHIWDGHMAVVLGRAMATRVDHENLISLFDSISARKADLSDAVSRDQERPVPFSFILEGYRAAYRYLQEIHDLGSSGLSRVDHNRTVEAIHAAIVRNIQHLPGCVKTNGIESPRQGDLWLPAAQETLFTELHFVLLALHRPYIFSNPHSREEAHNAALRVLASQIRLFKMSTPREYQPFNLVFATFDALVLIEAIYIIFPLVNESRLDASLESIQWGLEMLDNMRGNNQLAACAHNIVQSLYQKMMARLNRAAPRSNEMHTSPAVQGNPAERFSQTTQGLPEVLAIPTQEQLYSMQPPQPLHDLIFHSFASHDVQDTQLADCAWSHQSPLQGLPTEDFWTSLDTLIDQ
ncbi:Zn2 Cys6 DNA-binding [Fusarium beomiforme]|uniref:Zn2 Cys6 DNA-binding n=1 Tax=Fusarium beomiforme TaxID=44412 RepID=A0A9P5DWA8_9HYPO|nr:Zn2 Cys6 DNA-binding [Fusarium beomiforme]